jgi:hypothetical protein
MRGNSRNKPAVRGSIIQKQYRKQGGQCTCNAILGRVRVTQYWGAFLPQLLQWKSNKYYYSECVFVTLGIEHDLRTAPLDNIFQHYLIRTTIFGKKKKNITEHKMCVLFPILHLSETFLILNSTEQGMIKYLYWSLCKVPVTFVRF